VLFLSNRGQTRNDSAGLTGASCCLSATTPSSQGAGANPRASVSRWRGESPMSRYSRPGRMRIASVSNLVSRKPLQCLCHIAQYRCPVACSRAFVCMSCNVVGHLLADAGAVCDLFEGVAPSITSSASALSVNPVNPRRSQKSAVISRRWLSSCFSLPDATIRSATCGGRKRRSLPDVHPHSALLLPLWRLRGSSHQAGGTIQPLPLLRCSQQSNCGARRLAEASHL
jgi:hypothetical protein